MMEKMRKSQSRGEWILILVVFSLVFLMSSLTPLLADDYTYSFNIATGEPIASPADLVESLTAIREEHNGRIAAHALVQLLLLLPKPVFNFLNALNCVLLLVLSRRFLQAHSHKSRLLMLGIQCLLIWNFLPAFGLTFLWLDGAINYSWGLAVMLLYLWPFAAAYLDQAAAPGKGWVPLHLLLAFPAGAWSENGSIAIIFMALCFLVLLVVERRRLPLSLLVAFALSVLGFLFLMAAPSEAGGRASEMSVVGIAGNIKAILALTRSRLLGLYVLYAVLLVINWSRANRRLLLSSLILVIGGLGSLAAFSFAVYFTERHFCFTAFFLILAIVMLLTAGHSEKNALLYRAFTAVLAVVFLFNAASAAIDILGTYVNDRQRLYTIEQAKAAGETGLVLPPLLGSTEYSAATFYDLTLEDAGTWPNPDFARYHGLDWVMGRLEEAPTDPEN